MALCRRKIPGLTSGIQTANGKWSVLLPIRPCIHWWSIIWTVWTIGGYISGNAKSVGKYFLPKANDMSCAVISVVKSNLSRTSVSLMREPGKTIMICSTKMSARTGETKSIRQRKLLIFLLSVWKKCWLLLNPSKKKPCNGNRLWKRKQPARRNFRTGCSGRAISLWNWLNTYKRLTL